MEDKEGACNPHCLSIGGVIGGVGCRVYCVVSKQELENAFLS